MTFPNPVTTSSGNSGANATAHVVTLPTGIVSGDLLIVAFANDGTATASVTTPASGWTQLFTNVFDAASQPRGTVFYRRADGAEATTITITTSASEGAAWACYRITGAHSSTNPEAGASSESQSSNPNPPSLNPAGWDVEDTLWIAMQAWDAGNASISTWPANFTSDQVTDRWNNASGVGVAIATNDNATASVDPGTWTMSTNVNWIANTIAVRPGPPFFNPQYYLRHLAGASS